MYFCFDVCFLFIHQASDRASWGGVLHTESKIGEEKGAVFEHGMK